MMSNLVAYLIHNRTALNTLKCISKHTIVHRCATRVNKRATFLSASMCSALVR